MCIRDRNQGKKEEARKLFAAAIQEDLKNEKAWLGMAQAVEEEERYIECMQRVLVINPENELAKKVLQKYEKSQRLSTVGEKLGRYGIVALIGFIIICVPMVLFSNAISNLFSPRTPTPSPVVVEFTQTSSPKPSVTSSPTSTFTPLPPTATWTMTFEPTKEKQGMDLFPCIPNSPPITAEVTNIVSGDTIEVMISGTKFLVGYIGVRAPDIENDYGEASAEINRSFVLGKEVLLFSDVSEWDENGRLMRYVFMEDIFINYELLRLGYARADVLPSVTTCSSLFEETAQGAKNNSQGLWAFVDLDELDIPVTEEDSVP